ncbi:MAG TPA: hypothetical protein VF263_23975, partial [Longimicrobiaceae bacterium]
MASARRSSRMAPGSAFQVVLLLGMLGLSGVLAYQALDAARSELRSTERALRGYAAFAAGELTRRADEALGRRLAAAARHLPPAHAPPPDSAALAAVAARAGAELPGAVRGAFAVSGAGVRIAGVAPGDRAWVEAAVRGAFSGARGPGAPL